MTDFFLAFVRCPPTVFAQAKYEAGPDATQDQIIEQISKIRAELRQAISKSSVVRKSFKQSTLDWILEKGETDSHLSEIAEIIL